MQLTTWVVVDNLIRIKISQTYSNLPSAPWLVTDLLSLVSSEVLIQSSRNAHPHLPTEQRHTTQHYFVCDHTIQLP